MAIATISCPADCDFLLPKINFDDCAPVQENSELTHLYIALPQAANFADVTSPTEWGQRLSNDATIPVGSTFTVDDLIRELRIVGDIPAPSIVEKDISGGRYKFPYAKDYVINFDIDDISQENFDFARTTQCGIFKVKAWFKDLGNYMYGGNNGITGDTVRGARLLINPVYGRGSDEILKLAGTLTFRVKTFPDRCVSPI